MREASVPLNECRLLDGLPDGAREECVDRSSRASFKRGQWVARQGEPAHSLYVVRHGMLKLLQLTHSGTELIVRFVGPGGIFGGVVAIDRVPYPVSAVAVTPTETCAWDGQTLRHLVDAHPALRANIMREMAAHMTDALSRVREMTTLRVSQRLALALVRLARQVGRPTESGVLIDYPLTRQELAELAGTTLYTASRTLSQWADEGILQSSRRDLLIRAPGRLARLTSDDD
jgi:CRP-like cAMP-binding protein